MLSNLCFLGIGIAQICLFEVNESCELCVWFIDI